MKALLRGCYI